MNVIMMIKYGINNPAFHQPIDSIVISTVTHLVIVMIIYVMIQTRICQSILIRNSEQ